MKKFAKSTIAYTVIIFLFSCNSSKGITDKDSNKESTESLIQEGYVRAVIIKNKANSGCPLTVSMENSKELLDPLEIKPEDFQNEEKIWIKYNSVRMMNRCNDARPVKVIGIKKRDE